MAVDERGAELAVVEAAVAVRIELGEGARLARRAAGVDRSLELRALGRVEVAAVVGVVGPDDALHDVMARLDADLHELELEVRVVADRVLQGLALGGLELAVAVRVEVLLDALAERHAEAAADVDRRRRVVLLGGFARGVVRVRVGHDAVLDRIGRGALGRQRLGGGERLLGVVGAGA